MSMGKKRSEPRVIYTLPTKDSPEVMGKYCSAIEESMREAIRALTSKGEFVHVHFYHSSTITYEPHKTDYVPLLWMSEYHDADLRCVEAQDGSFRIANGSNRRGMMTMSVHGSEFIRHLDGVWLGDLHWIYSGIDLVAERKRGLNQLFKRKLPQCAACVQAHIVKALAEQGFDEALEIAQQLLLHEDINVKFDAALACLYLGEECSLNVLHSILARSVVPEGYDYLGLHQLSYERVIDGLTHPCNSPDLQTQLLDYLEQTPPAIDVELVLSTLKLPTNLQTLSAIDHIIELHEKELLKLATDLGQINERAGLDRVLVFLMSDVSIWDDVYCVSIWPDLVQILVNANHPHGLQWAISHAVPQYSMSERAIIYSEFAKAFAQFEDNMYVDKCFQLAQQAIDSCIANEMYWYVDDGLAALAHAYFSSGETMQALATADRITDKETRSETLRLLGFEKSI
ncbi:MAG: HEAT repeat domain-containing protein [Chloroflexota bacterium]